MSPFKGLDPSSRHARPPVSSASARSQKRKTVIDLTQSSDEETPSSNKRQRHAVGLTVLDKRGSGPSPASRRQRQTRPTESGPAPLPSTPRRPASQPASEKRLRRFRTSPPQAFHDVYERALSQRFYVLQRQRCGTADCPEEQVELTGSTGNIYTIHIGRQPSCTCPHALKGNQCKHVIYVLSRVLNASFDLVYQLSLTSSELLRIFANAPPADPDSPTDGAESGKRKPIEGDCPICFCELDADSPESVVWCRAACGQNIHQSCFQQWWRAKAGEVTCPFCRTPWQSPDKDPSNVKRNLGVQQEGYMNVADQLPGVSGMRDTSTYSSWYGRSRSGRGWYYELTPGESRDV